MLLWCTKLSVLCMQEIIFRHVPELLLLVWLNNAKDFIYLRLTLDLFVFPLEWPSCSVSPTVAFLGKTREKSSKIRYIRVTECVHYHILCVSPNEAFSISPPYSGVTGTNFSLTYLFCILQGSLHLFCLCQHLTI